MAAHAVLGGKVAVESNGGGESVPTVGFVTWFSVPDRPVSLNQLKLRWLVAELNGDLLPKDPRALYLFKRAMRAQEGKVRLRDGSTMETDVRDVHEDGEVCIYQISRVVKDEQEQVVDYPKAMRVTFSKEHEIVAYKALGEVDDARLAPMKRAISSYLIDNAKMIDGRKVRAIVRNFLKAAPGKTEPWAGLHGQNMRGKGGGVYFVADRYGHELKRLSEVLDGLYPDHSAYLDMVPLADDEGTKEMIRRRYIADALKECEEATAEVAKLLRDDRKNAVRKDVKEFWWNKLRELQDRAAFYEGLLQEARTDVRDQREILKLQIEKLI